MSNETEGSNEESLTRFISALTSKSLMRLIFVLIICVTTVTADKLAALFNLRVSEDGTVERLVQDEDHSLTDLKTLTADVERLKKLQETGVTKENFIEMQYQMYRLKYDFDVIADEQKRLEALLTQRPILQKQSAPKQSRPAPMPLSEFELQVLNGNLVDEKPIH